MQSLPSDVLCYLLAHLPYSYMVLLTRSCKRLHTLATANSLLLSGRCISIPCLDGVSAVGVTSNYCVLESIKDIGELYFFTVYDTQGVSLYSVGTGIIGCSSPDQAITVHGIYSLVEGRYVSMGIPLVNCLPIDIEQEVIAWNGCDLLYRRKGQYYLRNEDGVGSVCRAISEVLDVGGDRYIALDYPFLVVSSEQDTTLYLLDRDGIRELYRVDGVKYYSTHLECNRYSLILSIGDRCQVLRLKL